MLWGQVLVDVLVRAGSSSPATALGRPSFREECRKQIGDTGRGCTSTHHLLLANSIGHQISAHHIMSSEW